MVIKKYNKKSLIGTWWTLLMLVTFCSSLLLIIGFEGRANYLNDLTNLVENSALINSEYELKKQSFEFAILFEIVKFQDEKIKSHLEKESYSKEEYLNDLKEYLILQLGLNDEYSTMKLEDNKIVKSVIIEKNSISVIRNVEIDITQYADEYIEQLNGLNNLEDNALSTKENVDECYSNEYDSKLCKNKIIEENSNCYLKSNDLYCGYSKAPFLEIEINTLQITKQDDNRELEKIENAITYNQKRGSYQLTIPNDYIQKLQPIGSTRLWIFLKEEGDTNFNEKINTFDQELIKSINSQEGSLSNILYDKTLEDLFIEDNSIEGIDGIRVSEGISGGSDSNPNMILMEIEDNKLALFTYIISNSNEYEIDLSNVINVEIFSNLNNIESIFVVDNRVSTEISLLDRGSFYEIPDISE